MTDELKTLLTILAVSLPVGLVIGILLRKLAPGVCKRYAKSCRNKQWPLFTFGAILFAILAVGSFLKNSPYFGAFFTAFSLFELFCLFAFGFRRLTPEEEKQIDESDPSKLWPVRFWKKIG